MTAGARRRILFFSHSPDLYGAERSLLLLLEGMDRGRCDPVLVIPGEGLMEKRAGGIGVGDPGGGRRAAGRAEALVGEAEEKVERWSSWAERSDYAAELLSLDPTAVAVYLVASRLCDAVFGLGNERLLRAQLAALRGK